MSALGLDDAGLDDDEGGRAATGRLAVAEGMGTCLIVVVEVGPPENGLVVTAGAVINSALRSSVKRELIFQLLQKYSKIHFPNFCILQGKPNSYFDYF